MVPIFKDWADSPPEASSRARRLGLVLAFVAGATNAGGFLAIGLYTSHMTGVLSSIADNLVLGLWLLAGGSALLLCSFVLGAMSTALIINWGRQRALGSSYCLPLLIEAACLLFFGLLGARIGQNSWALVPATAVLLCFIMGLQNATVTKISHAEIRTTHITGLLTDLGIELGKLVYVNNGDPSRRVVANRHRLQLHGSLIVCFFVGGLVGAWGFKSIGYLATLPMALLLVGLCVRPVLGDLRQRG